MTHDSWSILVTLSRGFYERPAILKAEEALGTWLAAREGKGLEMEKPLLVVCQSTTGTAI